MTFITGKAYNNFSTIGMSKFKKKILLDFVNFFFSVLYFSIHRYEHGKFWPNLKESDSDYIGSGRGKGYNVNVPLNKTGLGDSDYLGIVFNLLLPLAYEVHITTK